MERATVFSQSYDREYGLLVGSGTTALTLACLQTTPTRRKVLLPAIACAHVLYSVLYAGCTPVFVDVLDENGLIDPHKACEALDNDEQIGAVVVVHIYGQIADTKPIYEKAKTLGVLVIEDAAQAQGGTYPDGRLVGSYGDLSVFSFGHTKILDIGRGGILMTNNKKFFSSCFSIASTLPRAPKNLEERLALYRLKYYSIWQRGEIDRMALSGVGKLHAGFRTSFLNAADINLAENLSNMLPKLQSIVDKRKRLHQRYSELLSVHDSVSLIPAKVGWVPWRFVFCFPSESREGLVSFLRRKSVDVSCWYPSLSWFYKPECAANGALPNAEKFANRVVNLWVDPTHHDGRVLRTCELISEYLSKNRVC